VHSVAPSRSSSANPSSNDRLQERLARALAAKNYAAQKNKPQASDSEVPSRSASPAIGTESPRRSTDTASVASENLAKEHAVSEKDNTVQLDDLEDKGDAKEIASPASNGIANDSSRELPTRVSIDSISSAQRQSTDSSRAAVVSDNTDGANAASKNAGATVTVLETTTESEEVELQRQGEIHDYIERIDALQAKLQYLAKESAEAARKAAAGAPSSSLERKLAEKDEQIALLMEEGQKLSKTELKHITTIKKLRAKTSESEKDALEATRRAERADKGKANALERAKRADASERQLNDRNKIIIQLQRDLDNMKAERDAKDSAISNLKAQLSDSASKAKSEEVKSLQGLLDAERKRVVDLEEDLSSVKIEKELAAERFKVQMTELRSKGEREAERARIVEVEMKGEIQMLEGRLEVMRARAEEVSSGATGDAQAKLLRQIETLQSQYAIASENWQGIEASLTSRVTKLQKERDEALQREADIRKRAREMVRSIWANNFSKTNIRQTMKSKTSEEDIESARAKIEDLHQELLLQQGQLEKLKGRAEEAESALIAAKKTFEKEKNAWQAELQQRLEEERLKWRDDNGTNSPFGFGRAESPVASSQKGLTAEYLGLQNFQNRRTSTRSILDEIPIGERRVSRPSSSRVPPSPGMGTPKRQDSTPSFNPNGETFEAPSITMDHDDEYFENMRSPLESHHNVQDVLSISTAGAGPSVQLVERMSAAVRRLESEKVSTKEELARLTRQRDEARAQIVSLMQEVEAKRSVQERVTELEEEIKDINGRYQTTLEMLGEKSERVEELKADVEDVKTMYRELVERTIK
jgi:hypothetical protein